MDPEYAPHLYDKKGKFIGNKPSHKDKFVKKDKSSPEPAVSSPSDRRIRSVVGDYRAVIPDGAQKGSRFFTNNSPVIIEKRSKDATGTDKWDRVMLIVKPSPGKGKDSDVSETDQALYWLLAGPDAE